MTIDPDLYGRLLQLAWSLSRWRGAAERLRAAAYQAEISQQVDNAQLVRIEGVVGEIYAGIETFNSLLPAIAKDGVEATGKYAEIGDALHLVLLEITELGTRMYRVRSARRPTPYDAGASSDIDALDAPDGGGGQRLRPL